MAITTSDDVLDRPKFARSLTAHLRSRSGRVNPVRIVDLSIAGCLLERQAMALDPGDSVLVRLPGLSNMRGTVLWIEDGLAAIEFEDMLHDSVFESLQRHFTLH